MSATGQSGHRGVALEQYIVTDEQPKRGGFSDVFQVVNPNDRLKMTFAVKVFNDKATQRISPEDLVKEGQLLAWLGKARNIVSVIAFLIDKNGRPCLIMEWLDGQSLRDYVGPSSTHNTAELLQLAIGICTAVTVLHDYGTVHGDIKPENIIIETGPEGTTPVLIDFGLSWQSRTEQWSQGATRSYAAPEQTKLKRDSWETVGKASDVYSLGAVLYFLFSGGRHYLGRIDKEKLDEAICNMEPRPLRELEEQKAEDLITLIGKMLEKKQALRPDIDDVTNQLRRFVGTAKTPAQPSHSGPTETLTEEDTVDTVALKKEEISWERLSSLPVGEIFELQGRSARSMINKTLRAEGFSSVNDTKADPYSDLTDGTMNFRLYFKRSRYGYAIERRS